MTKEQEIPKLVAEVMSEYELISGMSRADFESFMTVLIERSMIRGQRILIAELNKKEIAY